MILLVSHYAMRATSIPLTSKTADSDELASAVNVENKSNSTASAVQVKANMHEQFSDHLHFRKKKLIEYLVFKVCYEI